MGGLKLRHIDFNRVAEEYKGLSLWVSNDEVINGSFSDVTSHLMHDESLERLSEATVKSTRSYFDFLVIELELE